VNCTWPKGGRPSLPVEYCDETWTGSEYAWAALALDEGFDDEALNVLRALRTRYDGSRRNPFNEIECGDHYARSLAGWSVIESWGGWRYDAADRELRVRAHDDERRGPLVAGTGWGEASVRPATPDTVIVIITCRWGSIQCSRIRIDRSVIAVDATGSSIEHAARRGDSDLSVVEFPNGFAVSAGERLELHLTIASA
jgi:hypothetical protein